MHTTQKSEAGLPSRQSRKLLCGPRPLPTNISSKKSWRSSDIYLQIYFELVYIRKRHENGWKIVHKAPSTRLSSASCHLLLCTQYPDVSNSADTCLNNVCVQVCAHHPAVLSRVPEGQAPQRSAAVSVWVEGWYSSLFIITDKERKGF